MPEVKVERTVGVDPVDPAPGVVILRCLKCEWKAFWAQQPIRIKYQYVLNNTEMIFTYCGSNPDKMSGQSTK